MIGSHQEARNRMVAEQLAARGIHAPAVLDAMKIVPRHEFVPAGLESFAYDDRPLEIGEGQTISQPYIVAAMIEAASLPDDSKVLEVGTGSGYAAAVLAELGHRVYSIERLASLATTARDRLERLGYRITLRTGDGSLGWPEEAPFHGILVSAAAPDIPISLLSQLAENGRLVAPIGGPEEQDLIVLERHEGRIHRRAISRCRFVRLIGREGWPN